MKSVDKRLLIDPHKTTYKFSVKKLVILSFMNINFDHIIISINIQRYKQANIITKKQGKCAKQDYKSSKSLANLKSIRKLEVKYAERFTMLSI